MTGPAPPGNQAAQKLCIQRTDERRALLDRATFLRPDAFGMPLAGMRTDTAVPRRSLTDLREAGIICDGSIRLQKATDAALSKFIAVRVA